MVQYVGSTKLPAFIAFLFPVYKLSNLFSYELVANAGDTAFDGSLLQNLFLTLLLQFKKSAHSQLSIDTKFISQGRNKLHMPKQ
mmetsp:Transcript_25781/g.53861  ORF Transcript_25781/g.53861 Transcript_25781/m.53861 type:complete len:84 (+) Transcript_25781:2-253(+)